MMHTKSLFLSLFLCLSTWAIAQTEANKIVFQGRVVNGSGIPLNKAQVKGVVSGQALETGVDGLFSVELPAQGDTVKISKQGLAVMSVFVEFPTSGVFVLTEGGTSWMSENDYLKKMEGTAKVYYEQGMKFLQGDAQQPVDLKKAFACFWRAANMSNPHAAYQLGRMLDEGVGIAQNQATAAEWYKKANGVAEAQARLGIMFAEGTGVEQNYASAHSYLSEAIFLGDSIVAAPYLAQLKEKGLVTGEIVDDRIRDVVEKNAEFPGGNDACYKWIANHLRYPREAQEQGIQGRVMVSFVVNRDGSIVDVKVLRSPHSSLSREAVRLIKAMPQWTPATQGGKTVRSRFTIPLIFRLS